ncbi:cytochrome [Nocardia donostiensis]|nr:cytochrome [Nocardia donostiensis]
MPPHSVSAEDAEDYTAEPASCPVRHPPIMEPDGARIPLYTGEYTTDPTRVFQQMREKYGALAPIELAPDVPATLVIGYHTAVRILQDPEHFPADPRTWQQTIPADSPIRPAMEWCPNARRSTGEEHHRYRETYTSSIDHIDLHSLHNAVAAVATPLINNFCETGSADLTAQYVFPIVFQMINELIGCPPHIGQRIAEGMTAVSDASVDGAEAFRMIEEALMELVRLRREEPDNNVASWMARHPAQLDDTELLHQLFDFYGAGVEPLHNLIANALLLVIDDERFGSSVVGGSLSTRDAIDEVLFNNPPIANLCMSYPRQPILIDNYWLPAHQPVLISMAACNNDPAVAGGDRIGNRSHLAWGSGPHACPAKNVAYLIAQEAVDQLLDAVPEMELAIPRADLAWRPGPFARSLSSLPVVFPPSPPLPGA